jgi:hypothetical protein
MKNALAFLSPIVGIASLAITVVIFYIERPVSQVSTINYEVPLGCFPIELTQLAGLGDEAECYSRHFVYIWNSGNKEISGAQIERFQVYVDSDFSVDLIDNIPDRYVRSKRGDETIVFILDSLLVGQFVGISTIEKMRTEVFETDISYRSRGPNYIEPKVESFLTLRGFLVSVAWSVAVILGCLWITVISTRNKKPSSSLRSYFIYGFITTVAIVPIIGIQISSRVPSFLVDFTQRLQPGSLPVLMIPDRSEGGS